MQLSVSLEPITGPTPDLLLEFSGPAHIVLGRSRACSVRLSDDLSVSRQHCLIEITNRVVLQDLGSLNGTSVNGRKIGTRHENSPETTLVNSSVELRDGDVVRIGETIFLVKIVSSEPLSEGEAGVPSLELTALC